MVSKSRTTPAAVFNLEVTGEHVFYVGQCGVLVHNSSNYVPSKEISLSMKGNLPGLKKRFPASKNFADLGLDPFDPDFAKNLRRAMDDAEVIHFDASGMRMLTGKDGVLTGSARLNTPGSTNWELRTIFDSPELRAKTMIYIDGIEKTFDDLLKM